MDSERVILTIGIGNYFVNYAILRSGDGGDREVKNENAQIILRRKKLKYYVKNFEENIIGL